uniref:Uncharacterized protein n=1 Tax=Fagus sylvatica TaxID=28930 RepID=A0A2N9HHM6_FAGSY
MGCGGFAGMAVVGLGLPAWVCGGPILVVGLWWLWVVDFAGGVSSSLIRNSFFLSRIPHHGLRLSRPSSKPQHLSQIAQWVSVDGGFGSAVGFAVLALMLGLDYGGFWGGS